jgi:hypothetical protein
MDKQKEHDVRAFTTETAQEGNGDRHFYKVTVLSDFSSEQPIFNNEKTRKGTKIR